MKIVAVIPARYKSSRFLGKPLANICGKPMIQHVYERVCKANGVSDVFVATDDERIFNTVVDFGGKAVMTGDCSCGTERVYEASKNIDADIFLNVQGDEPLISPEAIEQLLSAFDNDGVQMATLRTEMRNEKDIANPNNVKVVVGKNNEALYFSRFPIPYLRNKNKDIKYYKHIGLYAYKKEFLKKYVNMELGDLEKAESLEQLRVLENGYKIIVPETKYDSIGVDAPDDIAAVEKIMNLGGLKI